MSSYPPVHVPVLLEEVLKWLDPRPGQTFVDGTLGGGGHTRALAERVGPEGRVLALDLDPAALAAAERNLAGLPVLIAQANFCDFPDVLAELHFPQVNGILLDLGLSSDQLADPARGFSFDAQGPLDLRFDPTAGEPAWRLLERLTAEELANLIYTFGEERFSRRIARRIVELRGTQPVHTADDLAALIRRVVPRSRDSQRIDPATRTFQALRIAVNRELESLERALSRAGEFVVPGGRLAIISFHSLEDRLVKTALRDDARWQVLTKKPIVADAAELARNPRLRSAKDARGRQGLIRRYYPQITQITQIYGQEKRGRTRDECRCPNLSRGLPSFLSVKSA